MIESYLGTDESAINRSGAKGASTPKPKAEPEPVPEGSDNGTDGAKPRRRTPIRVRPK